MGLLKSTIKKIQKEDRKTSPGSVMESALVPTGVSILDSFGGSVIEIDGKKVLSPGIPMGKIILFVGQSQSGKTTMAIKFAANIASSLNGDVILADFERSSGPNINDRIASITELDPSQVEDTFTVLKNDTLTTEGLLQVIHNIVETKEKLGKEAMVDYFDNDLNPIKIFVPTVVIIDSISAMRPQELLDKKGLDSNMVGATIAKCNAGFVTSILPLLEKYNITILGI